MRWSCFIVHLLKNLIFSPFGFREQFCRFLRNCRQDSEDNLDNQSILVLRLRIFLSDFSKNTFVISATLETKTDWQWYQKLPIQLHNHITIIMIMMAFRVLIDDNNGNQDNVKMIEFQILGGRSNGWSSSSRVHNNNQPEQRNGGRVNRAHWSRHREDKILKSESELFYEEFFLGEAIVINPEN